MLELSGKAKKFLADYKKTDKEIKKSIKADPNDLSTIKENSV